MWAIDQVAMLYQQVHLKRGKRPKSMLLKRKKQEKPYWEFTAPDPETGEMKRYRSYYEVD